MNFWNKIMARQLRRPSGLLSGIICKRLEKNNVETNNWVISLLNINKGDKVLEIGYGPGYALEKVSNLACNGFIAGIDFSQAMYKVACKRNKKKIESGLIHLECGDALSIPYEDNYFDKIYAINVAYFWKEPLLYLKELKRVLRTGGLLSLYLTDKDSLNKIPVTNSSVFNKYSEAEFFKIIEQAGFSNIKTHKETLERPDLLITSLCFIAEKS